MKIETTAMFLHWYSKYLLVRKYCDFKNLHTDAIIQHHSCFTARLHRIKLYVHRCFVTVVAYPEKIDLLSYPFHFRERATETRIRRFLCLFSWNLCQCFVDNDAAFLRTRNISSSTNNRELCPISRVSIFLLLTVSFCLQFVPILD